MSIGHSRNGLPRFFPSMTAALALSSVAGCRAAVPAVATFPGCPVPVLLSKVNRIGRKEAVPTQPTGTFDHFVETASRERTSQSWQTKHYEYTRVYDNSARPDEDVYSTTTHVIAAERSSAPHVFTNAVRELVPTSADVRASDIVVDRISVVADISVSVSPSPTTRVTDDEGRDIGSLNQSHDQGSGSMRSSITISAHKVWQK